MIAVDIITLLPSVEVASMSSQSKSEQPASGDDDSTYKLSKASPIAPEGIQPPPAVYGATTRRSIRPRPSRVVSSIGFNLLVFVTSVCVMMLELTASRLIATHVGSSLYTWTSVIGVVLAGITIGNWLGGWLADRFDRRRALGWMYLLGSVSCAGVLWLDQLVGTMPRPDSLSWPQWIVTLVGAIFFLPALAMGTVSPLVASMALENSVKTGSTVGNVYAWGALGSIAGTFLTGFYLIDVWGTRSIIGMTAGVLGLLAVLVASHRLIFRTAVVVGWLQLLGWTILAATSTADAMASVGVSIGELAAATQSTRTAAIVRSHSFLFGHSLGEKLHEIGLLLSLRVDPVNQYRDESNYSDISVENTVIDGRSLKALRLDKLIHSYYDPSDPTYLHYEYERVYAGVTKAVAQNFPVEPLTLSLAGLNDLHLVAADLPAGVRFDESGQSLTIARPTNELLSRLQGLAPAADYWAAIDQLYRESNKDAFGGFSAVDLPTLPEGVTIPEDLSKRLRHDETLGVLVAYQRLSVNDRDSLIDASPSAAWYRRVVEARQGLGKATACFYGGGGFIFPRWFSVEFPASPRIDVAELDPAVYEVVKSQLGYSAEFSERIATSLNDARNFVDDRLRNNVELVGRNQPPVTYDFIYADAFNDFTIPFHLTTLEFLRKTHDLLSDRGVFQANIIDIYPRIEVPGELIGHGEAEFSGRLPTNFVTIDVRRDRPVPASKPFAPLQLMELVTNRYRLQVPRSITAGEEQKFLDVSWPDLPPAAAYDVTKGVAPEIDIAAEREDWAKAIQLLASMSRKKRPFAGTIPALLDVTDGNEGQWTSAKSPYQFVEAYRLSETEYVLGFRGKLSTSMAKDLNGLDPQNQPWIDGVTTALAKSQANRAGAFLGRYVATAARIFPNVYVFSTSRHAPGTGRDTFVMVCARRPYDLNSLQATGEWDGVPFASIETFPDAKEPQLGGQMSSILELAAGQILTDDFAPVDNLLAPVFSHTGVVQCRPIGGADIASFLERYGRRHLKYRGRHVGPVCVMSIVELSGVSPNYFNRLLYVAPDGGVVRRDRQRHFCRRVREIERGGVQGDETIRADGRTVFSIADNRPALGCQLHANLMAATGQGPNFQQRKIALAFQSLICQFAVLSLLVIVIRNRNQIAVSVFYDAIAQGSVSRIDRSFDQCQVGLLYLVQSKLL